MNKIQKILLAILAGIETVVYLITPILLVILWVKVNSLSDWTIYLFWGLGLLATLFRGIKVSGFLKDPNLFKDIIKKL